MDYAQESSPPKAHILFVDDEESLTELSKLRLEGLGYSVSIFTESPRALAAFQKNPQQFDAVITDLTMPQLNGLQLACIVHELRPKMPIVLCTGDCSAYSDTEIKACGVQEVIIKPVLKKDWALLLHRVIG